MDKPIWKRNKTIMVLAGVAGVLAVTLGGAALGLEDEARRKAVDAILWLVGLLIGGHTVTDVGSQVSGAIHAKAEAAQIFAEAEMIRARNGHEATELEADEEADEGRLTPQETPRYRDREDDDDR